MHINIIALLLFFQSLVACQQGAENTLSSEANIAFQAMAAKPQEKGKTLPLAANIVFQSTDGGQTWQDISAGLPKNLQVGSFFAGDGQVFLGSESGLYRSSTTSVVPIWEKEFFVGEKITNISPGQAGPYLSSYGSGFLQEILNTGIWIRTHNALEDKTVRTVLETPDGTVFVGCDSGIFKSADGRKTWKQVFADGMVNSLISADDVLICGSSKGLLRSTDGGEHWDWVLTEDGEAQKTERVESGFVAITRGGGTWKEVNEDPEGMANRLRTSADGGKTWQRMDEHLAQARLLNNADEHLSSVWVINDIAQAGKYLFCSLDTGIFRSSDLGKSWELVFPANGKKLLNLAVSGKVIYAVKVVGC